MPSYADSVNESVNNKTPDNGNVTAKVGSNNPKVAASVYETGPRDSTVPVDNFGRRAVSYINQQAAGVRGAFDGFFNNFKILGAAKETIAEIGQIASDALREVEDSKREIEAYTGLNLSSLGALKDSLSDAAVVTMSNITGVDIESAIRDGEDIIRICEDADLSSVNGILSTTNKLMGNDLFDNIVDMRAETAIWSGLLQQAARLGMVDLYDVYWDEIYKNDSMYGSNYGPYSASMSFRDVVQNGDLIMMNKLIDSTGGPMLLNQYPEAMMDFLQNYRLPYGKGPEDYPELRKDITDTFARLDPEWFDITINELPTTRLDAFTRANNVAKAVFTQNSTDADRPMVIAACIADSYPRQDAAMLLNSFYPYMAVRGI